LIFGLDFPPIEHVLNWKDIGLGINKVALICFASVIITLVLFMIAGSRSALVPRGVQNIVEAVVDFVRNGIILQTMGPDGLGWLPYLTTRFFFILFANIFEVIPLIQFPAPARMAIPLFLALLSWILYNVVGIRKQGFGHYLKSNLIPPGVPKALLVIVVPIEFLSNFIVRPFSLAVRLFANELAGHLLLVTFAVLSAGLWALKPFVVIVPLPFVMLILLTGFEAFVAVLQAFIFTILTAVYIGGAMHPEH